MTAFKIKSLTFLKNPVLNRKLSKHGLWVRLYTHIVFLKYIKDDPCVGLVGLARAHILWTVPLEFSS